MERYHPTAEDGTRALRDHIVARAHAARERYGPSIDLNAVLRMLSDASVVRYPTELRYSAAELEPGEFAHAKQNGVTAAEGYTLFIHPHFQDQPDVIPLLVAYHIVDINYGEIATAAEAELFGAALHGMKVDAYYHAVCALVDGAAIDLPATE